MIATGQSYVKLALTKFKYLGAHLSENGCADEEIKKTPGTVGRAF